MLDQHPQLTVALDQGLDAGGELLAEAAVVVDELHQRHIAGRVAQDRRVGGVIHRFGRRGEGLAFLLGMARQLAALQFVQRFAHQLGPALEQLDEDLFDGLS